MVTRGRLTVKVLSPEKSVFGTGRWYLRDQQEQGLGHDGKCKEPPRGLRPRRASHGDHVATREIRQSALSMGTALNNSVDMKGDGKIRKGLCGDSRP